MDDGSFEERTSRTARRHAESLDPVVTTRLERARREAVGLVRAQGARPRRRRPGGGAVLVLALAGLAVLAVALWERPRATPPPADSADLEILLGEAPLELYQELDLYLWLEQQGLPEEVDDAP